MAAPVKMHDKIQEFVIGEENSALQDITEGIAGRQNNLLELVESLGLHLTSQDVHIRCRATTLLAKVVHDLSQESLNEKESKVLVAFFCDRLKDHHSITPPVLKGLCSLALLPQLPEDDLHTILRSIFREIHVQTLVQSDRREFYNMIEFLLRNRLPVLRKMGGDIVYGFMQSMDSEKDPRNLTIAFRCASLIGQHLPVGMFAEEFFEVVSCYFPIDFSPPPNDPHGISKEELVLGLRNVFASSSKFGQFAVPLLLEKLQSTILNSKIDSLHTLAACAEVYGPKIVNEFCVSFWSCIRREVFTPISDVLERASLAALTAISRTLSTDDASGASSILEGFLNDIFKDLKKHLCEPELRLMYPCSKLLLAAGAGSIEAYSIVFKLIIPLLQEQFAKHQQSNPRRNIVDIMNSFVTLAKNVRDSETPNQALEQYKDKLFSMYVSILTDSNNQLRNLAGQGLVAMAVLDRLLTTEEIEVIINHLTRMVQEDKDDIVRKECFNGLSHISRKDNFDEYILQKSIPQFIRSLNEEPMEINEHSENNFKKHLVLEGLVTLSTTILLVKNNLDQLMQHLETFCIAIRNDENLHEVKVTCNCVQSVTDSHIQRSNCADIFKSNVLVNCWKMVLKSCCEINTEKQLVLLSKDVLDSIAGICRTIVSNISDCGAMVTLACDVVLRGDTSTITCDVKGFNSISNTTTSQCSLLPLFNAVVCCTKGHLGVQLFDDILGTLSKLHLESIDDISRTNVMMCVAALLNKIEGEQLDKWIKVFDDKIEKTANSGDIITSAKLLVWVCKAVVMRGAKSQGSYVQKVLSLLANSPVADICAEGFRIILEDNPSLLNVSTHANVKLMYKQRFFMQTLPALVDGFNKSDSEKKQFYLKALSYHLKYVPKEAVLPELPNVLPLVVQSLGIEETSLLQSTLTTIKDITEHSPDVIASHLDDIVPRLLTLSRYKPSMKVRIAAFQCIAGITSLPHHLVFPHQNEVVRSLAVGLDDHKRLVRKEAVDARCKWFMVGAK